MKRTSIEDQLSIQVRCEAVSRIYIDLVKERDLLIGEDINDPIIGTLPSFTLEQAVGFLNNIKSRIKELRTEIEEIKKNVDLELLNEFNCLYEEIVNDDWKNSF